MAKHLAVSQASSCTKRMQTPLRVPMKGCTEHHYRNGCGTLCASAAHVLYTPPCCMYSMVHMMYNYVNVGTCADVVCCESTAKS